MCTGPMLALFVYLTFNYLLISNFNKITPRHQQSDKKSELGLLRLQVIISSFFVLIASVLGESKLSDQTPLGVLGVQLESNRIPGRV
jgi:hypothetical protein